MTQRSNVPKFGDWESEPNVPYTAYFEKARKGRSGAKVMNPNDPRENPLMFSDDPPNPKLKPRPSEAVGRSRGEGAVKQFAAHKGNAGRGAAADDRRYGVSTGTSPSNSSYGSSRGTPGRSLMKPSAGYDELPDKSLVAVPKFGGWDDNNPTSADGYTQIFNKIRKERQSSGGRATADPSYINVRKPVAIGGSKACCFPWAGK